MTVAYVGRWQSDIYIEPTQIYKFINKTIKILKRLPRKIINKFYNKYQQILKWTIHFRWQWNADSDKSGVGSNTSEKQKPQKLL